MIDSKTVSGDYVAYNYLFANEKTERKIGWRLPESYITLLKIINGGRNDRAAVCIITASKIHPVRWQVFCCVCSPLYTKSVFLLLSVFGDFGTEDDFKALVEECHKRDIWVMIDVVANHVGPVGTDYSKITPFNSSEHYHDKCSHCSVPSY